MFLLSIRIYLDLTVSSMLSATNFIPNHSALEIPVPSTSGRYGSCSGCIDAAVLSGAAGSTSGNCGSLGGCTDVPVPSGTSGDYMGLVVSNTCTE